ncbi:MAG: hypothetical protein U0350_02655 [Caldilineaceae bacterium]
MDSFLWPPLSSTKPLTRLGISLGLLLFAIYPILILTIPLRIHTPLTLIGIMGFWQFLLSWLVFGYTFGYLLACFGVIGLAIFALAFEQPERWQQLMLTLVFALILFFVLAPYRPAVQAAPGYQLLVPTTPAPFWRGLKNAQAMGEYRPCIYKILGWQQTTLFYQSRCGNMLQNWRFDSAHLQAAKETLGRLPTTLETKQLTHEATLAQVSAGAVYPPEAEYSVRGVYVPEPGFLSPDGKWLALVSKHLYAAEDVVIVTHE